MNEYTNTLSILHSHYCYHYYPTTPSESTCPFDLLSLILDLKKKCILTISQSVNQSINLLRIYIRSTSYITTTLSTIHSPTNYLVIPTLHTIYPKLITYYGVTRFTPYRHSRHSGCSKSYIATLRRRPFLLLFLFFCFLNRTHSLLWIGEGD
jgi:hypothetical protein